MAAPRPKRVHEIAKELNVDSKAIINKCVAEGIVDVKTHMSPVKLGLEQTIREWFSAGHNVTTAIETAEKVDLSRLPPPRAGKRRKAFSLGDPAGEEVESAESTQTAVAEPAKGDATQTETDAPETTTVATPSATQVVSSAATDASASVKAPEAPAFPAPAAPVEPPPVAQAPAPAVAAAPAAPTPSAPPAVAPVSNEPVVTASAPVTPVVPAVASTPAPVPAPTQTASTSATQRHGPTGSGFNSSGFTTNPQRTAISRPNRTVTPPPATITKPSGPSAPAIPPGRTSVITRPGLNRPAPGMTPPGTAVRNPQSGTGSNSGQGQNPGPLGNRDRDRDRGGDRDRDRDRGPAQNQPTTQNFRTGPGPNSPPASPAADGTISAAGRPNVPNRPTFVRPPAAPFEKPGEAVLRGPRVVRIDKPDVIEAPRPRRAPMPGQGGAAGGNQSGTPNDSGISRSRGPARGRGAGAAPPVEAETPAKGATKRRSLSTRRGRSAEALPVGPSKFSEQDLLELDARLNHATGFLKQRRRDLKKPVPGQGQQLNSPAVVGGKVEVYEPVTIKALSSATGIKSTDIIKFLFKKGIMATINSAIDTEAAMEAAMEYNIDLEVKETQTVEQAVIEEFEGREEIDVRPRPPVVTVLGHVDHGKTSLLDRIRKADVAAHEAGGITQHVGAYRVTITGTDGRTKTVVFLDTPGHEAFTTMRARGAKMTDLVVLVVAADDGVMPQTIESINHAKAAGVPIIVALNKIDKAEATDANIRKIFGQLAEHGLNPTEWGGTTEVVRVSATKGTGVNELLEILDYQAELLELKADFGGTARGTVIEAQMLPGRGPVARMLVQQGHLGLGDFIVIGRAFGRVRDMTDEYGKHVTEAGPATPLEISGIDMIPDAGDKFYVTETLQEAEEIATQFREAERHKELAAQTKVTLDNFAQQIATSGVKELRVVLKVDVQGSIKPLVDSLSEIGNAEVAVKVLHAAVGGVTASDVTLADASDAVIIGFHVVAPPAVREIAEAHGVEVRLYRIIYEAIDDIKKSLEGMLTPEKKEEELGVAEVREAFRISKVGAVAGCMVVSGTITRTARVRVVRDSVVITDERQVESLRRLKEDAKEVRTGMECGVKILNFDDVKPGDRLVFYKTDTIARKLVPQTTA